MENSVDTGCAPQRSAVTFLRKEMCWNMKIATFNIRCDCEAGTTNGFENRRGFLQEKILKEKPELIGFQEVLPHVADWLQEALPGYYVLSCGRGADYDDEAVSIAYRTDSLNLLSYRTFWLSDTPEIPGSRYEEQSMCPRVCSIAVFLHRESGRLFAFYNTHLDHEADSAKCKGMELILEDMAGCPYPAILTGDFNVLPDSEVIRRIESASLSLSDVTRDVDFTFHGYGIKEEKIDYIYVGKEFSCESAGKWTECHDGVYLSDHYPVCAEIVWKG